MQVIVLCAGRGKRLRPYTKGKPKPLVNINGKPILEYILDIFAKFKPKEIIIVIGYKGKRIIENFGYEYKGIKITYVKHRKHSSPLAYSLHTGIRHIHSRFFVILGDTLIKEKLIERMLKQNADIVIPIFKDPEHEEGYYGIVVKNNKIIDVSHKFSSKKSKEIFDSPGIFLCSKCIAKHIEKSIEQGLEHRLDFLVNIKNIVKIKLLKVSEDEIIEIDTRKDLRRAKSWLNLK